MSLLSRIETALGTKIVGSKPLSIGFGLEGLRARLADGREVAVKASREGSEQSANLKLEGWMLQELTRLTDLPSPRVHAAEPGLLVMDWVDNDGGGIGGDVQSHAAEFLAALHAVPREAFGCARDTLIGPLHQPNPPSDKWIPFFRDQRLTYMAKEAHDEGQLSARLLTRIVQLGDRLDNYLTEPAHPALIHGDLWTGNVLVRGNRIAGFVDPAIYCAHPEIELAFMTMFGTFGQPFFETYEALSPIEPGFRDLRRDIYNLYPTLVHVRLFGASYLPPIDRMLARLGL